MIEELKDAVDCKLDCTRQLSTGFSIDLMTCGCKHASSLLQITGSVVDRIFENQHCLDEYACLVICSNVGGFVVFGSTPPDTGTSTNGGGGGL